MCVCVSCVFVLVVLVVWEWVTIRQSRASATSRRLWALHSGLISYPGGWKVFCLCFWFLDFVIIHPSAHLSIIHPV